MSAETLEPMVRYQQAHPEECLEVAYEGAVERIGLGEEETGAALLARLNVKAEKLAQKRTQPKEGRELGSFRR